jgi:uncharacterized protein (TIGR03435 family)
VLAKNRDCTAKATCRSSLPSIFAILGKLGLELNQQEDVLPVYTVEHIERPTDK